MKNISSHSFLKDGNLYTFALGSLRCKLIFMMCKGIVIMRCKHRLSVGSDTSANTLENLRVVEKGNKHQDLF